jgi:UDP-3-O-[3-hydroxymyristoyl] glucosamine N-acyltransferase
MKVGAGVRIGRRSGVGAAVKIGRTSRVGVGARLGKRKVSAGAGLKI